MKKYIRKDRNGESVCDRMIEKKQFQLKKRH